MKGGETETKTEPWALWHQATMYSSLMLACHLCFGRDEHRRVWKKGNGGYKENSSRAKLCYSGARVGTGSCSPSSRAVRLM